MDIFRLVSLRHEKPTLPFAARDTNKHHTGGKTYALAVNFWSLDGRRWITNHAHFDNVGVAPNWSVPNQGFSEELP